MFSSLWFLGFHKPFWIFWILYSLLFFSITMFISMWGDDRRPSMHHIVVLGRSTTITMHWFIVFPYVLFNIQCCVFGKATNPPHTILWCVISRRPWNTPSLSSLLCLYHCSVGKGHRPTPHYTLVCGGSMNLTTTVLLNAKRNFFWCLTRVQTCHTPYRVFGGFETPLTTLYFPMVL